MDDNRDPSHTQLTPLQERLKREEEERNKRLA